MPRKIHQEQRILDILAAMRRYSKEQVNIPFEWTEELDELIRKTL